MLLFRTGMFDYKWVRRPPVMSPGPNRADADLHQRYREGETGQFGTSAFSEQRDTLSLRQGFITPHYRDLWNLEGKWIDGHQLYSSQCEQASDTCLWYLITNACPEQPARLCWHVRCVSAFAFGSHQIAALSATRYVVQEQFLRRLAKLCLPETERESSPAGHSLRQLSTSLPTSLVPCESGG